MDSYQSGRNCVVDMRRSCFPGDFCREKTIMDVSNMNRRGLWVETRLDKYNGLCFNGF